MCVRARPAPGYRPPRINNRAFSLHLPSRSTCRLVHFRLGASLHVIVGATLIFSLAGSLMTLMRPRLGFFLCRCPLLARWHRRPPAERTVARLLRHLARPAGWARSFFPTIYTARRWTIPLAGSHPNGNHDNEGKPCQEARGARDERLDGEREREKKRMALLALFEPRLMIMKPDHQNPARFPSSLPRSLSFRDIYSRGPYIFPLIGDDSRLALWLSSSNLIARRAYAD